MKIHADLTYVYGANCVSQCNVYGWIGGFRAGKVIFEDGHGPDRPVSGRNEKMVIFVEKHERKSTVVKKKNRLRVCSMH